LDQVGAVELEQVRRDPADGRPRRDHAPFQTEMPVPPVTPRVEQAHQPAGLNVDRGQGGSLVPVAHEAGPGAVALFRLALVCYGDDVIRLVGEEGVTLVDQAVLTPPAGPLPDQPPEGSRDGVAHRFGAFRFERSRAFTSRRSDSACSYWSSSRCS